MPVIEMVRLKLMPGVDEQPFLQQNDVVQRRYIPNQLGFISRETAKGNDGEWIVVVHWKSMADAEASMQKFTADPTRALSHCSILPSTRCNATM